MHIFLIRCLFFWLALASGANSADLIVFWDKPQRGGNSFNRLPPDAAYFAALKAYGASWVRLSYDKWPPTQRDFLLGNADQFSALAADDLATLLATLDRAHAAGLKVVVAPLSLPGMRWAQNNDGRFDGRLWEQEAFWRQAAAFWRDLAFALKDHPAVAAYNLVNEPAPEKQGGLPEHADAATMQAWYAREKGGSRDLLAFYHLLIHAIREVDDVTPIMVDTGWYGAVDAIAYWPAALADSRVLYSFHMYEPYAATSAPNMKREHPYAYPGAVPFGEGETRWDAARVQGYLQGPVLWAKAHGVPPQRLVVGEFGCMRRLSGCPQYLDDVLTAIEANQWHWAFYSFREDSWDGMDYELGTQAVPWRYWQAVDAGAPDPIARHATPVFEPIRARLQRNE